GDDATIIAKKPAKADDSTVLAKHPNKKPKAITDDATVLAKKPKKIADDATVLAAKKTNSDSNHATGSQTAPAKHYTEYRSKTGNNSTGFAKASELAEQALSGSGAGTLLKKRFLLEDALGQGGMGTVYKTKDLRKVEAE